MSLKSSDRCIIVTRPGSWLGMGPKGLFGKLELLRHLTWEGSMRRTWYLVACVLAVVGAGTSVFAQRSQAESIIQVPANTTYTVRNDPDPPCHHWDAKTEVKGVECVPICVLVPRTATGLEPEIAVKETGDTQWFNCPRGPGFWDCAAASRSGGQPGVDAFGWIRVYPLQLSRTPLVNGKQDQVCYDRVNNWSHDRARHVRLIVKYLVP